MRSAAAAPPASRRATSSSRRSSSRPLATASSSRGAELDEPAALLAEGEDLAQPGLAGVQALDDLLDARERGLVGRARLSVIARPPRCGRDAPVGEAQGDVARGARRLGGRHELAARILHQRVAALERALRVVGVERRGAGGRARGRGGWWPSRAARSRSAAAPSSALPPRARSSAATSALRSSTSSARRASARSSRDAPPRGGAHLAQVLVQARALARDVLARARATCAPGAVPGPRRRGGRAPRGGRRRPRPAPRASPMCSGTAVSAAWVGVEQQTAATSSSSVRSVWWPTDAITGTRQQRDGAAQRLVAEGEQVGERAAAARDDHDLDLLDGGQVLQRAGDARRGMAVLHRREGPHQPPAPAAAAQPGEDVVARLAALAGDHADGARQQRPGAASFCGANRPSASSALAQPVELGEQVALARDAHVVDAGTRTRGTRWRCPGSSRGRRRRRPARRPPAPGPGVRAVSRSVRHIEHGTAPRASRSSKYALALATRAGSRPRRRAAPARACAARSRSISAYAPTANGPGSSEPGMPAGRRGRLRHWTPASGERAHDRGLVVAARAPRPAS